MSGKRDESEKWESQPGQRKRKFSPEIKATQV